MSRAARCKRLGGAHQWVGRVYRTAVRGTTFFDVNAPLRERWDNWADVAVPGLGEVHVRRLTREEARTLVKLGMDTNVDDALFRDRVLAHATSLSPDGLTVVSLTGRHRAALAVLRVWGLETRWRRLYGSELSLDRRMRHLLISEVREQARARTVTDLQDDLNSWAAVSLLPVTSAVGQMAERALAPSHEVQRRIERIVEPLLQVQQRLGHWLEGLLGPVREAINRFVRRPAVLQAARRLSDQARRGVANGPIGMLLRTHLQTSNGALRRPLEAPPAIDESRVVDIVIPDDGDLVALFAEQRGDRKWRQSSVGWLLQAVPLPLGGLIHEQFSESAEAGLAWLAERLLRRELRRALSPALAGVGCDPATIDVLLSGVDHYLRREWAPADTLLTAGLDGLLFEIAVQRRVLTEGHKLRRPNGRIGGHVSTAGRSDVLAAMGFDGSQITYLTNLSLGPTGNPPRHGSSSPLGSDVHAAGSLLGLLLVLAWLDERGTIVAELLLTS